MKSALVALVAVRLLAAGDLTSDFFPANTKVVFGVRVPAIVESALFKDSGTGAQKLSEEWLKVVAITGFDPLHDIDEILLASPADNEKAAALLVLRGRFDLARLGAGAARYHGVAMVGGGKDGKDGKGVLALLDATTLLAGDTLAVRAAIDRRGHNAALDGALAARLQSLRERFDVWGTGERQEGFVSPTGKNEQLDSMDRFEFGVRISHGFELGAEIHARSPKDADKMAASLQLMKAMMSAQDELAPKIDVQVNDGTIKISLAISEEGLKKMMAARRGATAPVVDRAGPPVIVNSESTRSLTDGKVSGTSVFVLPGKK
jgi:hypothetical protein